MKIIKWAGLPIMALALLALVQGCMLTPQKLSLDPVIDVTSEAVTTDTLIGLSVVDARPTKKLGEVGDPNKEMLDVTVTNDFIARVNERLTEALEKRGFSVVPKSEAMTRSLDVEINSLVLNSVKRPIDFETKLEAAVSAKANNSYEKYDRAYYVRTLKESAGPPYEKKSNKMVNDAMSQALSDLLNDDSLFEMLAR